MSENRQRAPRKRAAKCGLATKKCVQSKTNWLEDLDAYRGIIYQISQSKGVLHDYF